MSSTVKSNILANAAKLTSLNILLQILLRASTFVANAIILRYLDKELLGLINGHLILLYTTCQFMSREATRRACTSDAKSYKWNVSVNCIWLNIPILFVVGNVLAYVWTNLPVPLTGDELIEAYQYCVLMIVVLVLVELLAEPFYIYGHLNGFIKCRVLIEGFTQMFRTFGMVLIVFYEHQPSEILIQFATLHFLSSIGYSLIYYFVFFVHFQTESSIENQEVSKLSDFMPTFRDIQNTLSLMKIVGPFFIQTIFKQLLTEGERYVMKFFNLLSLSDQGIYHAINNLSSLAARFVFAPIEESSYLVFAQFIDRNKSFEHQSKSNMQVVNRVLRQLLKLMLLIGMIVVFFGFNYSQLVLLLYGGKEFASQEAIGLMRWQCVYVAIIAINGVTETFTFASMSKKELIQFNYLMILLSIVFLASNFLFVNLLGSPGFVLSVCVQMVCRIAFSFYLIGKNFNKIQMKITLKDALPSRVIIGYLMIVFVSLFVINNILQVTLIQSIVYIAIGSVQLALLAFLIYKNKNELICTKYFFVSINFVMMTNGCLVKYYESFEIDDNLSIIMNHNCIKRTFSISKFSRARFERSL